MITRVKGVSLLMKTIGPLIFCLSTLLLEMKTYSGVYVCGLS